MNIKQQQSQMLSAIFSLESLQENSAHKPSDFSATGLSIYQHSLLANASRALAITFATVHSFIGETGFSQLVKKYLQKHLKTQFDWGELGDNFPHFIHQQSLPNSEVLAAIATLDFACHHTERAENVEKDLTTLSLLNDVDAYQLKLNFAAGFKVIKLDYPADLIITDIHLKQLASDTEVINKVKHAMKNLPFNQVSLESVSGRLCMSPRTLRRHLQTLGVSFKTLLENERRNIATKRLDKKDISLDQLAELLGYNSTSSFSRAFKRWYT